MQSKFANKISKVQIFNHNFNNYDKSQIGIKNKIWSPNLPSFERNEISIFCAIKINPF